MSRPSDRYVSSAFDSSGIDSTLGNMLGADPMKPQFCCECGKKIESEFKKDRDGKVFCLVCQAHLDYGSVCVGCGKRILGEFITSEKGKYHGQCFNEEFPCDRCHKPIIGEITRALNKTYHKKCFTCHNCNRDMGGVYTEIHGSPYCKKCADDFHSGRGDFGTDGLVQVKKGPSAASLAALERNKIQLELADNVQKGKEICAACRKPLLAMTDAIQFDGKVLHDTCFTCTTCLDVIGSGGFVKRGSNPYCLECSKSSGGSAPPVSGKENCGGCGKPITDKFINVSGKKYHPSGCFVCSVCRGPIGGGFTERGGRPVCAKCASQSAPGPTVLYTKSQAD
eukprot:TRINITY_DN3903_c0_g1_i2.p1 TRINITY_DN3903_c0_g1~~TRINITY_DN3903_c0_g1_i2.p1  ORF type:complete len:338 (+),score=57.14 TRINITY_DN3903_c0_g1_i2:242-1255(+)